MTDQVQVLNITVPDLAAQQFAVAALNAINEKFDTRMTAEELARAAADAAFTTALTSLTDRVVVLEQRPDLLTDAEKASIEKAVHDFIAANDWSWFTGDLSIPVNGVNVSLKSAVQAILSARQYDRIDWSWGSHYCPIASAVHFTDGTAKVFSVTHDAIAAEDMQAAVGSATPVTNPGERNTYTCSEFAPGVPASLFNVFEIAPVTVAGVTVNSYVRRVDSYLTVTMTGFTPATAQPPVNGIDVDGNGTTDGSTPPPPPPAPAPAPAGSDPTADALAAALSALNNATSAAATAASLAGTADTNVVNAQAAANQAQSDLGIAQGTGDQAQIDAAQAVYDAAALSVTNLTEAATTLHTNADALAAAVVTAQAALDAAQAAYDAAH